MFCPNCGTQNDSAASPCKKCGFKLSGVSAPKFKGTMMMNSEQSVQDLVDEHKRKREADARSAGAEPPAGAQPAGGQPVDAPSPSPSAAPPPVSRASVPVLQPPRAAASKRRMGGTMLGVAPQAGGIIPPTPLPLTPVPSPDLAPAPSPSPPAARAEPAPRPEAVPAEPEMVSPPLRPDALAGTVAMPMVQPAPAASAPGRTQSLDPTPRPGRTQALGAVDAPLPAAAPQRGAPPEPEPAPGQRAHMPEQDSLPPLQDLGSSGPAPRRVRPLEIFLIVATCGLYGLVMLMRQRKAP